MTRLLVVPVAVAVWATTAQANPGHEILRGLPEAERTRHLASVVNGAGHACSTTGSLYMGLDQDDNAYYTVICASGHNWMATRTRTAARGSRAATSSGR